MKSIKELRGICQKPVKKYDNLTETIFERPFSIYFTKFFLLLGINANQVTVFFNLLMVLTAILFTFGKYWYTLIGVLILRLAFILDNTDGEIARYNKIASINGEYLDIVLHFVVNPLIIFGLSFGLYQRLGNIYILVLGFIASTFFLLVSVVGMARFQVVFNLVKKSTKAGTYFRDQKEEVNSSKKDLIKKGYYYFSLLFRMIGFSYIILIAAIFDLVYIYLFLIISYAIILPIIVILRIYYEYNKGLERFIPHLKLEK